MADLIAKQQKAKWGKDKWNLRPAREVISETTLGTPAVGQAHVLTAAGIASTPTVGSPSIGQVHALDASDITAAAVVGSPSINAGTDELTASGIVIAPVVGTPALTETVTNFFVEMAGGGGSSTDRRRRKKRRAEDKTPAIVAPVIDRAAIAAEVLRDWTAEQAKIAAESEADDEAALVMMAPISIRPARIVTRSTAPAPIDDDEEALLMMAA